MHVFGLTGGIGSGKSTVAELFEARGVPMVSADALAREVVVKGSPALREIVDIFGDALLFPNGELDRTRLAARVFADAAARSQLEAITHPQIRDLAQARFAAIAARGEPLAGYDVPLLFERQLEALYRPVVVVNAPEVISRARAATRDGVSTEQVEQRQRAQLPLSEKVARADFVVENGGELRETAREVERVLTLLCHHFGVPRERYALPG